MSKAHKARQAAKREAGKLGAIALSESPVPIGKAPASLSAPYRRSEAILDNLLFGTPIPEPLKPQAVQDAERRAAIEAELAAKLSVSPLVAVCHKHECQHCGATWQSFGFYARLATQQVIDSAAATYLRRVDVKPEFEPVSETRWIKVPEARCFTCYQSTGPQVGGLSPLAVTFSAPDDSEDKRPVVAEALDKLVVKADWTWRNHLPIGAKGWLPPADFADKPVGDGLTAEPLTATDSTKGRYPAANGKPCEPGEALMGSVG